MAGHSLGGRIAVRTAAKLMEYNADKSDNDKVFIKKIILAGAAIDNDDKDIASTWLVSNETVVNLINTQDIALAFYCWIGEKHAALGTGYKSEYPKGEYKDKFHEIPVHKSLSHDKYFKVYKMLSNTFYDEIVAPQVRPNLNWNTMNKHMWWDIVDECHGWELQKNLATSRYRIVDDNNVRRAWGHLADAKEVIEVFEIIKGRLIENKGKPEMPNNWWMLINPKQDEFTIYTQKNEDSNAWKTLEQYEGWKFQITKKSEGKAQTNIDAQKADNYRVKRETFENAKNEYFAKIYEYKFFKKRWSRILDKAYYARLEDKFDERLEKDLEEELANAYDEKMDSKQKEEVINEFKKELDANLNSEVDEELSRDWEKEFNDRIDQLKNGLDKKQYKELLKQSDAEFDKEVEKLTKVFDDEKKQLDIQLRIGAYDKKQYNEEYEYLKEDYKEKKYQLKKVYNDKVEQLNNQLYKKLYKELYNDLKEEYKTQKKQLEKDIEGLKKDYKEKEKEYEEVKKYDRTECRILDPENRRRAKGNQTNLKESFEHVKKQIDNLFTRYNN